jgi:imidazolonepropionase-like amidohydrolase
MRKLLLALVLLAAWPLAAQPALTAVRAKRLLDVRRGVIVENPVVIVEGDRIREVARAVPPGATVIELGDVTLLPGLFDMHTHIDIGRAAGPQPPRSPDFFEPGPIDRALEATRNARATLMAGFTTIRQCGANDFIDVALKRAIDRGTFPGPRITPSGYQISMTGGHGDNIGYPEGEYELTPKQGVADGPEQLLFAVRYQLKHGAEVIKLTATAGVLGPERTATARQFSDEELRTIVDEARRNGVRVAAHAHGTEGIIAAIRAGVDSIEHGSMLNDEAIRLMKEHGTWLVPTLYVASPRTREGQPLNVQAKGKAMEEAADRSFRAALAAGVKIAFGTDAGVYPHGLNAGEFTAMVDRGMTPLAAIRAATINAAELLGVDDRGVIEPGKLADLIAVAGNPLDDVSTLETVLFVMKGGDVFKRP